MLRIVELSVGEILRFVNTHFDNESMAYKECGGKLKTVSWPNHRITDVDDAAFGGL